MWARYKVGSICMYTTFRAKLRLNIFKIMSTDREEKDFKDWDLSL